MGIYQPKAFLSGYLPNRTYLYGRSLPTQKTGGGDLFGAFGEVETRKGSFDFADEGKVSLIVKNRFRLRPWNAYTRAL